MQDVKRKHQDVREERVPLGGADVGGIAGYGRDGAHRTFGQGVEAIRASYAQRPAFPYKSPLLRLRPDAAEERAEKNQADRVAAN